MLYQINLKRELISTGSCGLTILSPTYSQSRNCSCFSQAEICNVLPALGKDGEIKLKVYITCKWSLTTVLSKFHLHAAFKLERHYLKLKMLIFLALSHLHWEVNPFPMLKTAHFRSFFFSSLEVNLRKLFHFYLSPQIFSLLKKNHWKCSR